MDRRDMYELERTRQRLTSEQKAKVLAAMLGGLVAVRPTKLKPMPAPPRPAEREKVVVVAPTVGKREIEL